MLLYCYYPVVDALKENFPWIFGAVNPAISFSRMNPLISPLCLDPSLEWVAAQMMKTSASGLFVIQFLLPLNVYVLVVGS